MRYYYKGKFRKGWVNIVNPFRGTWVVGTPGSGKTFSIIEPFIRQHSAKNRGYHVEPDVQTDGIEPHVHTMTEKPYRQYGNEQSTHQRIEHLTIGVALFVTFIAV